MTLHTPHQTQGPRTQTPDPKHRALRELNTKIAPVQSALNQAQLALNQAQRLIESNYQRERTHIINAPAQDDDWELQA